MWVQWLFFLSKDVINYCYHAMWEHVAVRGAITLWSEPKDMVTVFFFQFVSSPIVLFLAVKQNLSQPKLNLLLLWSRSRRILKERRVKRLLPQSRSGRIMNRKRQLMTCFKSEEYTSFIIGLWPASSRRVLVCAETTNETYRIYSNKRPTSN